MVERSSDKSATEKATPKGPGSTQPGTNRAIDATVAYTPTPSGTSSASGSQLGPYRLLVKLGEGGMGAVYKAQHVKLDKIVAIKLLPSHFTQHPEAVARFEREMKAVGKLEHPHIVRAMDAGEIDGVHYLAMEYVEGTDLQAFVHSKGPLSVINACKVIRQAALALAAAHGAGLVHRDIKPANLLLAKSGQIKLLDLGLALIGDDGGQTAGLTTAGQTFGTPDYMAPEQWDDPHGADGRVDLYALGCTLYFLLTGRAPYGTDQCKTAVSKLKAHVTAPIPDLRAARADISELVVAVYEKLMAKVPEDRYQSAAELAQALLPFTSPKAAAGAHLLPATSGIGLITEAAPVAKSEPAAVQVDTVRIDTHAVRTTATDAAALPKEHRSRWTRRQLLLGGGGLVALLVLGVVGATMFSRGDAPPVNESSPAPEITSGKSGGAKVVVKKSAPTKSGSATKASSDSTSTDKGAGESSSDPPTPQAITDSDAELARWVLSVSGNVVEVVGGGKSFSRAEDLPSGAFRVSGVTLNAADSLTDADLLRFRGASSLEKLLVLGNQPRITDQGLANLADACGESLKSLSLDPQLELTDEAASHLNRLTNLRNLTVRSSKITNAGLSKLSLPQLETLCLTVNGSLSGLREARAGMPRLQGLQFQSMPIPASELSMLSEFNLKSLWLEQAGLKNEDLASLSDNSALESLTLKQNPDVTDVGTQALLTFKNLRHLELDGKGIGDATCERLKELPELTSLSIRHTGLSDAGIAHLAKLPKLKVLWITGSEISNAALTELTKCSGLEELALGECPKLTKSAVDKLASALPSCRIVGEIKAAEVASNPQPLNPPSPSQDADNNPIARLAPKALRMDEGSAARPPFKESFKPGEPLGEFAAVGRPAKITGLLSWSVEPLIHRGNIQSIALSRTGVIATGSSDCVIRLWTSDWQLIRILPGHANSVVSLAFSPDGQRLASVSPGPREFVAMWDVGSGQLLWAKPYRNWHGRLSWSPDGTRLAVCEPGKLILLDPTKGTPISEFVSPEYLNEAAWSSDGSRIALVRDRSSKVRIVDPAKMSAVTEFDNSSNDSDAAWSGDGRWLAVSDGKTVSIYDARAATAGQTVGRQQHIQSPAYGLQFSPDSTLLTTAHDEGARVFKTSDWSKVWHTPGNCGDINWSHDGSWLLAGTRTLNAADGKVLKSLAPSLPGTVVGPSPDGSKVATAGMRLRTWNGDDGSLIADLGSAPPGTQQLLWNNSATQLLRLGDVNQAGTIAAEILDPATGKPIHVLLGHSGRTWRAAWSKSGDRVATVGEDGQCIVWEALSGRQLKSLKHPEPQWWVQWSGDGTKLATGSRNAITVWKADTHEQLRAFRTLSVQLPDSGGSRTNEAPFSFMKDSNNLTTLGKDGNFDKLDVKTGQIVPLGVVTADGGGGTRYTATWSPDSKVLTTATGYRELELFATGSSQGKAVRFFVQPYWLADSRRLLGGDNYSGFVMGIDIRNLKRLGVLMPELPEGEYLSVGPDGNYKGSEHSAEHVGVVALHMNGSLKTYSLDEFSAAFGKKNEPSKVGFLKIKVL